MNNNYRLINLFTKQSRKQNRGFTLIELLVVVIIVGVLAAIGIPSYIAQIGKTRESEAKINLGSIAKAQQAYHFEKQTFSNNLTNLSLSYMANDKYYSIVTTGGDTSLVQHQATAIDAQKDQIRNYAVGVYYNAGIYNFAICQAVDLFEPVDSPTTFASTCTNNGVRIK
jgi:type IV pilus assembly protein PilA